MFLQRHKFTKCVTFQPLNSEIAVAVKFSKNSINLLKLTTKKQNYKIDVSKNFKSGVTSFT